MEIKIDASKSCGYTFVFYISSSPPCSSYVQQIHLTWQKNKSRVRKLTGIVSCGVTRDRLMTSSFQMNMMEKSIFYTIEYFVSLRWDFCRRWHRIWDFALVSNTYIIHRIMVLHMMKTNNNYIFNNMLWETLALTMTDWVCTERVLPSNLLLFW